MFTLPHSINVFAIIHLLSCVFYGYNGSSVGVLLVVSDSLQYNSSSSLQAIEVAINEVNERTDLLEADLQVTEVIKSEVC